MDAAEGRRRPRRARRARRARRGREGRGRQGLAEPAREGRGHDAARAGPGLGRGDLDVAEATPSRSTSGAAASLAWCSPTPRRFRAPVRRIARTHAVCAISRRCSVYRKVAIPVLAPTAADGHQRSILMPHRIRGWHVVVGLQLAVLVAAACGSGQPGRPGHVRDEAMRAGRTAAAFPAADEDYFHDMDGGSRSPERRSRGATCGSSGPAATTASGTCISGHSLGSLDFLKTLSSHPTLPLRRDNRLNFLGLVNEPCFSEGDRARPEPLRALARHARPVCAARPVRERRRSTRASQIGARGKTVPVGSVLRRADRRRRPSAVPEPGLRRGGARSWDSERYYRDPSYYESRDLVRPYRVGMSCAFCHVGPNPVRPPPIPRTRRGRNLTSNVGAQFFWVDRIFDWQGDDEPDELPLPARSTRRARARSTRRSSPPTTSTTRGR